MLTDDDVSPGYIKNAMSLEAEAIITLYKIEMFPPAPDLPATLYLSPKVDVVWQGKTWESFQTTLAGELTNSDGEFGRPKFSLANPNGLFSSYIHKRWLDNAIVTRYKVLKSDIDLDVNSYRRNMWKVSKTLGLSKTLATLELRGVLDGQYFTIPGRRFQPPEFAQVSLE